ncbi:MAG: ribokinase [Planctomycetaceae bacterium]|nr:ribokinase [Planctomycetaceae bacterium]
MKTPHVVVVGSSNTDMVVKSERIPRPGETVIGGEFVMAAGGKGANQAVAAARLGAKVTFIARVGSDMFGHEAVENYRREGINTDWVICDPKLATGIALILVDAEGENLISVASGANNNLSPADVTAAESVIASADMVVMQLETPLDTIRHTARLAAKHGVPVILDPAPAPAGALPDDVMQNITYLKPNETEASRLTGINVVDDASAQAAADALIADGAKAVIVTLGSRGVLIVTEAGKGAFVPARQVKATDATAAGDAFSGAMAVALGRGETLLQAAGFAVRAAALSVTRIGAQPSLPTAAEVAAFQ